MRHKTKAALDNILDTMTGSDGCIKFLFYTNFIKAMDKRAKEGDKDAEKIIEIIIQFSRLIDVSQDLKTKK